MTEKLSIDLKIILNLIQIVYSYQGKIQVSGSLKLT